MADWRGHKAATVTALQALLEHACTGSSEFTWPERVLCTVCECWAAARHRALGEYLGDAPESTLWLAEVSFTAVGLASIAAILRRERIEFTTAASPIAVETLANHIERTLARVDEPVDEVISRFAADLLGHTVPSPPDG